MKTLTWTAAALLMIGTAGISRANDKQKTQAQAQPQADQQNRHGYLGINIEAIPAAMRSHMPEALPEGQGVLVDQVSKDSPASKAGLKANDILLSFDDKKISSPEDLIKLVRSSKAGQNVNLSVLRGGKKTSCQATLGEAPNQVTSAQPPVYRFRPDEQFQSFFEENEAMKGENGWKSFESLKLTKTNDKQWCAEVEYLAKDGKKESKKFTGSREEIRKAIESDKDLPREEQHHLLRSMNFHAPVFEFYFPSFGYIQPNSQQP